MSACDTEEEDQDSDYPDLVQDSEDEDDECNKEQRTKEKTRSWNNRTILLRIRTQVFFVVICCLLA
jgi:hypothetical protein